MSSKKKVTTPSPVKLGKTIQEEVISQISGSSNTRQNTVAEDDSKKMTVVESFGNKPTMKDILNKAKNNNPLSSFMAKINKK